MGMRNVDNKRWRRLPHFYSSSCLSLGHRRVYQVLVLLSSSLLFTLTPYLLILVIVFLVAPYCSRSSFFPFLF
ncbi:hypothetical protein BDW74DRAFT_140719 [Aspergillus multicolor]|uniref:uncharacterized protein n=1 Tax=Aspergillus multicolor TaxID=41759 RepID=UPI003CCD4778